jgi:hypothetical protein
MREITAFLCSDGMIFHDEANAKIHDEDLLGQEIDGLLRIYCLDITRTQEYKGCLSAMKNRAELKKSVTAILSILEHGENDNAND